MKEGVHGWVRWRMRGIDPALRDDIFTSFVVVDAVMDVAQRSHFTQVSAHLFLRGRLFYHG